MQKKKCDQPCDGCPWMKKNQTAKAVAASPVDGRGQHWFSKENILRHWRAAGEVGAMLPCHMTDENAPLYGGKPTKKQDARICVGLSLLARREVTAFMVAGQDFKRYRELPGKRWSSVGLAAWAARLYYAGAVFHMGGRAFKMPTISADSDRVGLPWKDSVHDSDSVGG
jgi:hypothetical protein